MSEDRAPVGVPTAERRIMAAAEELFSTQGFKETSIQQLADQAGVNRALIFYYFQSKEGLYRRLLEEACEDFRALVTDGLQRAATPTEGLRTWVTLTCEGMAARPHLLRLILREVVGPAPSRVEMGRITDQVEEPLRRLVAAGVESGELRPVDPGMTAISLCGLLVAFFRRRFMTGEEFAHAQVAEHVLGLVLEGLLQGPAPPSPAQDPA